jgi:hypothetical protein
MTAAYRLRQGLQAILAFTRVVDVDLAAQYLSPELMRLFSSMNRDEQLHSLNVLQRMLAQGNVSNDLAVAALLHDVGKSRYPIAVWQKSLAVLVKAFLPRLYAQLGTVDPVNNVWQRPFIVYADHPAWSAQMLHEAGASDITCWLVEHHAEPIEKWVGHPYMSLLARLQCADDAS